MVARSLMSRSRLAISVVRHQVAENVFEFLQVLHRVPALPQRGLPLFARDVAVARQAPPVRLRELALQRVSEGLLAGVHFARRLSRWDGRLWFRASLCLVSGVMIFVSLMGMFLCWGTLCLGSLRYFLA